MSGAPTRTSREARRRAIAAEQRMTLCETLDRVLNKGVVIVGHLVISIADIDLLYVELNVLVSSVETMQRARRGASIDARGGQAVTEG